MRPSEVFTLFCDESLSLSDTNVYAHSGQSGACLLVIMKVEEYQESTASTVLIKKCEQLFPT